MKIHIIYNPNRHDGSPEVRVHRAGCRDIMRDVRPGPEWSACTSHYETAGTSKQDIAEDFHADFIEEGSMTAEDAMNYCWFLPCTVGLAETSDPTYGPEDAAEDAAEEVPPSQQPGGFPLPGEPWPPGHGTLREVDPVAEMIMQAVQHHMVTDADRPALPAKPDAVEMVTGHVIDLDYTWIRVALEGGQVRYFSVKVAEAGAGDRP